MTRGSGAFCCAYRVYLMTVFPYSLYTVCQHFPQCRDHLTVTPFHSCWWQLTSDALRSCWSLFNKLDPPISSRPSGLSLWLPAPSAWPWCRLRVGVPKAPVTGYIDHRHSPTPSPPGPGRPGRPLMRAGMFKTPVPAWPLPSNLLTAPICLPAFRDSKSMRGTHAFIPCIPYAPPLSFPSPCPCSPVCRKCCGLLLIRWLSCLPCDEQSSCTSEALEAEWSLKAPSSLLAGECFDRLIKCSSTVVFPQRGNLCPPSSFFFGFKKKKGKKRWLKKFRGKDISQPCVLSSWHRTGTNWTCRFGFFLIS